MRIQKTKRKRNTSNLYRVMFFLMIAGVAVLTGCYKPVKAPTYDEEVEPTEEVELFGIVSDLDEVNGSITIRSMGYETEYVLTFTGAADVRDKYGDIKAYFSKEPMLFFSSGISDLSV